MTFSVVGFLRKGIDRVRPRQLSPLTGEERSHERNRRVALTAASSAFATGVGVLVSLISVPLTVRYLGTEQYGLWVTITSVAALMGFADLGLSSGLVNGISEAQGNDDERATRQYVASAFYLLILVSLILGVGFAAIYPGVSWPGVFNVASSAAGAVAGPALAVFIAVTLVGLPLGIAGRIRAGYQEGFANGAWQAVGSVVSLIALVIVIVSGADLPWLVLALGAGPLMASLLNGGALLRKRPWLAPHVRDVTQRASGRILRLGMLFFIVQVASVAAFATDNLVIARILGAETVTQYAVPMKLFMLVPLVSNLAVTPLWPAYREALTRRDLGWVRQTLRRSIPAATAWGVVASSVLVVFGRPIIQAWAGDDLTAGLTLLLALGLWSLLLCVGNTLSVYMNAANVVGFQAVCLSLMVVVNLALSIALTRVVGVSGPAWGSVISTALILIVPYSIYVKVSIGRFSRSQREPDAAGPGSPDPTMLIG